MHFAPTKISKDNLIKENVGGNIFVNGNTVIDSLLKFSKGLQSEVLEKLILIIKKLYYRLYIEGKTGELTLII